jgi:hypothetical protein
MVLFVKNLKSVPRCAIPQDVFVEASGQGGSGFMNEYFND